MGFARMRKGTDLHPADKAHVLATYVHRFTGEHRPAWAGQRRPNGELYELQFKDDQDWLEHTEFHCRLNGRLDKRHKHCFSNPTWPLRKDCHVCAGSKVHDLANGKGEEPNLWCPECGAQKWKGLWYTAAEWETWMNEPDGVNDGVDHPIWKRRANDQPV